LNFLKQKSSGYKTEPFTVKVSFLARDRERDRERLTFHHDHFDICQEYRWGRYGTLIITRQERNFHCI